MSRRMPELLPRLLADCVLPCAFAAMALAGVLTVRQYRHVGDDAQLRIAVELDRLAAALQGDDGGSTQRLLDRARLAAGTTTWQRIELQDADGRALHSGVPANPAFDHYHRELPAGGGRQRSLTVQVDPGPLRREHRQVVLGGVLTEAGLVLLTLLSTLLLHRHVLLPLRRLQGRLDAVLQRVRIGAVDKAEPHREFKRLAEGIAALAAERATQHAEQASTRNSSANDALEQLRQSQAALRSKARFVALVGHHFRQPTQALQLIVASLHPGVDAEQQALLAQMRDSVASMTRLLDALLEIARLDAGVVGVTPAPFSVAELFLHDRAALLAKAQQRGVKLLWRGRAGQLHGDIGLAAALLYQLAGNAIAHAGPHGRVLVCARRLHDGVRIEVRDNSLGIAAIHQQRIFEEFVQLHDDGDAREGYGLGLAIASRLARVLGTRVGLRSRPGAGSTFWFELPRLPSVEYGLCTGAAGNAPAPCPTH